MTSSRPAPLIAARLGVHIPRGVVHYYVNSGKEVGVVLVVYSPTPGPKDRVIVEDNATR